MIGGAAPTDAARAAARELLGESEVKPKGESESSANGESEGRTGGGEPREHKHEVLHRDVRLPDERPRLRADGRASGTGRLRARRSMPRDADVVVINTCSVRERAEEKLYTRLGEIRQVERARRGACRSSPSPAAWRSRKAVRCSERSNLIDVIVGTQSLKQLPALVGQAIADSADAAAAYRRERVR